MKSLITSTAIALLIASGAIAESHVSADGSSDEQMNDNGETMVEEIQETVPSEGDAASEGSDSSMSEGDTASEGSDSSMSEGDTATMTDDSASTDTTTMSTDTAETETDGMSTDTSESDMVSNSPMDGYSEMTGGDITADQLEDADVYGGDNEELGEIDDLVLTADGMISEVIIDVGGFLGIGEKPVAMPFDAVTVMQQDDGDDIRVFVQETKAQLEEMPEYTGDN